MTPSGPSPLRKVVSWLAVAILAAAIICARPSVAMAAPGDAFAVGFLADLEADVVGGTTVTIDDTIGAVDAPPDESASLAAAATEIAADLGPLGTQTIARAGLIETTATSGTTASAATAQVTEAEIGTAGGILAIDAVGSAVNCPVGGPATADVTPPASARWTGPR